MTFAAQFNKLKDNWLLVALIVLLILFSSNSSNFLGSYNDYNAPAYSEKTLGYASERAIYQDEGFAPDVEKRIKIKTAQLSTEVENNEFKTSEQKLKSIITSSDSILLNENVRKSDTNRRSYTTGYYQLKVDTKKYDTVTMQLKDIGEVKSFNENTQDVTGSYSDLKIELNAEKERLVRYEKMYDEATKTDDKINLNDRIFNQERRVKYLEESLENIDSRVEYSQISVTLTEKRSAYANIALVKFSELVTGLVRSFNSLLSWTFSLLPWTIAFLIVRFLYRRLN
jgi:hypothetical protein